MRRAFVCLSVVVLLAVTLSSCGFVTSRLPRVRIEPPASQQAPPPAESLTEEIPGSTVTGAAEEATSAETDGTPGDTSGQPVVMGTLPKPAATSTPRYIPVGAQRTLTTADLAGLSKWQLDILRNEIYAAHGRSFDRSDLRKHFAAKSWYRADPGYSESKLSALEKRNAAFIAAYQKKGSGSSGSSSKRSSSGSSGYVLPFSSSRRLVSSDLQGLSRWQLEVARNEIYARHGRVFKRADLRSHFGAQPWYSEAFSFSESQLSKIEKQNVEFIRQYER